MKTTIKVGDVVQYNNKKSIITDVWFDDQEYRVEVQNVRGKALWCVRASTIVAQNKQYR